MRPPFAYLGGKQTLGGRIAALLPDHGHYVEPFGGSLAVLFAKPPSRMETVNDVDGDLMMFWQTLRDKPEELTRLCALTPHSRAEYAAAQEDAPGDGLEQARRAWVRISQGRGGTLLPTGWRHYVDPSGSSIGMPGYLRGYVERMHTVAERLIGVSLECRPALELVERYGRSGRVLVYADPPYPDAVRSAAHEGGDYYRHEMRTEGEHRELAAALLACRAAVVVSGYPSELYGELYGDWDSVELGSSTGQAKGDKGDRARVEKLWSNRPLRPAGTYDMFDALAHESAGVLVGGPGEEPALPVGAGGTR